MQNFLNTIDVAVNLIPGTTVKSAARASVIIGRRTTNGTLLPAQSGFDIPDLYRPIELEAFQNGNAALAYLKKLGLRVELGPTFSLSLPEPDSVTTNVNGTVTLQFDVVPYLFTSLPENLQGTVLQDTSSGTIVAAQVVTISNSNVAQLIVKPDTGDTFTTADPITINGISQDQSYPDPERTDEICMLVYNYYQTGVDSQLPVRADGSPFAYLSIVSDRDASVSPSSTPIALAKPDVATVNGDGTVSLRYNTLVANLGYLPLNALGNTTVTQATSSATGVFQEMIYDGTGVTIIVNSVSGTFDTTNTLSVVLDATQNIFALIGDKEINECVLAHEIKQASDYTTHNDFIQGVRSLNIGQINNNKFYVQGVFANISTKAIMAINLPNPLDSLYFRQISYPYSNKFMDTPLSAGQVAATISYLDNNFNQTYSPQDGIALGNLPVSSDVYNRYNTLEGGNANDAINRGWTPLGVNAQGQVYIVKDVTSLLTVPGTGIPDVEFRFQRTPQCIRAIIKNTALLFKKMSVLPNNEGRKTNSDDFRKDFADALYAMLDQMQTLGIVQNLSQYAYLIQVLPNPQAPQNILVRLPAQIVPGLGGANITLDIFSVNTLFNTAA